jgi:hypothetical protein
MNFALLSTYFSFFHLNSTELVLNINFYLFQVAEKTALLRPVELKLVPVALEGSAFKSKFLDTDELMSYCRWFAVKK